MLTKSDFLKFIQCPKYLWLQKHRKDLIPKDINENLQNLFDEGYEVESCAYKLFPNGVDAQADGFDKSITKTKELMSAKTSTIFQPTISDKELFCRADIIKLNEDGKSWDIYEVKSSTEVKDINIHDLSFQKICFETAGYEIGKIHVICIDNQYVRHGEIEPKKLLKIENITEQVQYLEDETKSKIELALKITKQDDEIVATILKQCSNPYECLFLDYCWKDVPDNSIYDIAGSLPETKLKMLLDMGILEIKDIPDGIAGGSGGDGRIKISGQSISGTTTPSHQ